MTAKYDLNIDQGSNFNLWIQYLTDENTGVDLQFYNAEMQLKRFRGSPDPLLVVDINGLTYGYTGGYNTGIPGDGGILLNKNYDNTGITGGIYIDISPEVTEALPYGKYFYDLKLIIGSTYSQRLLEGRISVTNGVA